MKKQNTIIVCALCAALSVTALSQSVCAQNQTEQLTANVNEWDSLGLRCRAEEKNEKKNKEKNEEPVEKVKYNLQVGSSLQLEYDTIGKPDDSTKPESQEAKWVSSDPSIATVTKKGKVTAKKPGKVQISYYEDGEKKVVYEIKVFRPVTKIKISNPSSMKIRQKQQLTAVVSPSNAENKGLRWTSSNAKLATVSSGGLVKAKRKGTVKITCKAVDGSRKKDTVKIRIK